MSEQKAAYISHAALVDRELEDDYMEDSGDANDYNDHVHDWRHGPDSVFDFVYRCECGARMTPLEVQTILNRVCQDRYSGFGKLVDLEGNPLEM